MDAAEIKEADTRPHRRVRSPGARCTRHCWGDEEVRRGRRESDEEWEAMEQLLAGRLPEPSVMDQDPPEDIMREYDTRVATSLKALQQTAASIIKVREGKRKGLEAERKERVAAETERLKEG